MQVLLSLFHTHTGVLVSREVKGDILRKEVRSRKVMEKHKAHLNPKPEHDHPPASYGVFHHQRTPNHPVKAPHCIPVKARRIRWRHFSFLINFFLLCSWLTCKPQPTFAPNITKKEWCHLYAEHRSSDSAQVHWTFRPWLIPKVALGPLMDTRSRAPTTRQHLFPHALNTENMTMVPIAPPKQLGKDKLGFNFILISGCPARDCILYLQ